MRVLFELLFLVVCLDRASSLVCATGPCREKEGPLPDVAGTSKRNRAEAVLENGMRPYSGEPAETVPERPAIARTAADDRITKSNCRPTGQDSTEAGENSGTFNLLLNILATIATVLYAVFLVYF